jgi:hypothetical protein
VFTSRQVRWATDECARQLNVGPLGVYHMLRGFAHARTVDNQQQWYPTITDICTIGAFVEPDVNTSWWKTEDLEVNFRRIPVVFRNGGTATGHPLIFSALRRLTELADSIGQDGGITVDEYVTQLLYIHPFVDGNGRTASIVYNWLSGSLMDPVPLPDYHW